MKLNTTGLQIKNVSCSTKQKNILKSTTLEVAQGEVLGIIGPNGSGKTSLLKTISGQRLAESEYSVCGDVLWLEQSLWNMPLSTRAKILSVVNQLNDGVFSLNLEQIVEMGALPRQSLFHTSSTKDKERVDRALTQVGLFDKKKSQFNRLSGGEQQRGLIARSLVQQAQLMILDEPINHLDVFYQQQILALLKRLAKEKNITVVMSLHDLNLAKDYCDKVCLLKQGEQIGFGTPETVLIPDTLSSVFNLPCHHLHSEWFNTPRVVFGE